jgi:hypothetical protein
VKRLAYALPLALMLVGLCAVVAGCTVGTGADGTATAPDVETRLRDVERQADKVDARVSAEVAKIEARVVAGTITAEEAAEAKKAVAAQAEEQRALLRKVEDLLAQVKAMDLQIARLATDLSGGPKSYTPMGIAAFALGVAQLLGLKKARADAMRIATDTANQTVSRFDMASDDVAFLPDGTTVPVASLSAKPAA